MPSFGSAEEEAQLVRRAQAGDRSAFDELLVHYRPAVRAITFDLTGRMAVAEELAQDAVAAAWVHLGELRDPGAFAPWLRRIAVNCCRMWLRRTEPELVELGEILEPYAEDCPPADVWQRLLEGELHRALVALPADSRAALLMSAFGDMTDRGIAGFLGVPVTTVEGRIYRARRQLRARLHRFLETLE